MERISYGRSGLSGLLLKFLLFLLLCLWASKALQAGVLSPAAESKEVTELRKKVRQIYVDQLGVREKGVNSGLEVERYLRYVNLPKGNPWCAAFVCWVYGQAGVDNPKTGWSPSLFPASKVIWSRSEDLRFGIVEVRQKDPPPAPSGRGIAGRATLTGKSRTPSTGDVFGLYFPEKGRIAHVGFVEEWNEPWVVTVEGNTNALGSREGDGVYRKRRLVRTVARVARYVR